MRQYFGLQKKDFLKRIIGMSGQSIMIVGENVYVNNMKQENPPGSKFIRNGKNPKFPDTFSVKIPSPNEVIVIDNLEYKDFLFLYHLAKQENANVEAEIHVYKNGEFQNSIPFSKVDNWIQLKGYIEQMKSQINDISFSNLLKINGKVITEYKVKNDNFFVMGDNRDNSLDSRFYGFVNKQSVKGKAKLIYWSIDSSEFIINVIKWVRWNRIGMNIL